MEWLFDKTRRERYAAAAGATASLICGVHCLALPLFSALMLFAGVSLQAQASLEIALMAGSFLLAVGAFLPAALAGRNPFALQSALLALLFFVGAWQLGWLGALVRQSLSVSAALMLLLAHAQNFWQMRRAPSSAAPSLQHCHPHA